MKGLEMRFIRIMALIFGVFVMAQVVIGQDAEEPVFRFGGGESLSLQRCRASFQTTPILFECLLHRSSKVT
jgi:hypothetical protein